MPEPRTVAVHGRFQPFHLGHLEYLQAALEQGDRLIVGITNYDRQPGPVEPASAHRHRPDANPFTYFERQLMILETLDDLSVSRNAAFIVPFPIEALARLVAFIPPDVVHVVRVWSDWEAEKARRLREYGWEVLTLRPEGAKLLSGSEVRQRLRAGGDWGSLVPPGTERVIRALDPRALARRLESVS